MVSSQSLWPWKLLLAVILIGMAAGTWGAVNRIDYTWRWERIPQYLINTEPRAITAPFDGVIEIAANNKTLTVVADSGDDPFVVTQYDLRNVEDGDMVFEGDPIAGIENWQIGPITWGLVMTLKISVISLVFAMLIGLFTGLARISANPAVNKLAISYIELVRGTPLLVQIFIFYFFIGTVLDLDRFTAGVAALSVFTGAYIAEIIRSGIQSIAPGQMEAARSLGMNYIQAMTYVILPQAFKRTLPPMAGQFINLIKDSSLVSVISITDLSKAGREVVNSTFAPFEVWFTVALLYLVLTGGLSWLVQKLEKRLAASD